MYTLVVTTLDTLLLRYVLLLYIIRPTLWITPLCQMTFVIVKYGKKISR